MRKNNVLRKILAVSLAAAMMAGTGFTAAGRFVGTDTPVNAYSYQTFTYGDFRYQVKDDNTIILTAYTGNGGDVVIPDTIDGKKVTETDENYTYDKGFYGIFTGCEKLTSVVFPDSMKIIGGYTFYGCRNLKSVTLGNGVESIGTDAFLDCKSLTSITLPDSLVFIGESALAGCTSLTEINAGKNNPYFASENGVLFNKNKTSILLYPCGRQGAYTIPDSVKTIGNDAFKDCTGLTSVTMPANVTSIGYAAFSNCSELKSITIPKSVKIIDYQAFSGCYNLTDISVKGNAVSIAHDALSNTAWYRNQPDGIVYAGKVLYKYKGTMPENTELTIPDGVTAISAYAFSDCKNLKNITIPDSVTLVGSDAFKNTGWYRSQSDGIVYAGKVLYEYKGSLPSDKSITIPDGIVSISGYAFYDYRDLKSITIPDSVTSIGGGAFRNCSDLTNVNMSNNVTEIGTYAFYSCYNLENINISNKVTYIGASAFYGCSKLTNISLPDSLTYIGQAAFYDCNRVKRITIPDSVVEIGSQALGYYGATGIKRADFTLYGEKGGYAESYALKNGLSFVGDISANEIVLGGKVTVNAKAVLDGDYTYSVLYKKKSDTKWTTKQNFSENDTVTIKPAVATDYDICIKVKNSSGRIIKKKYFTVKVNEKLQNTSVISSTKIKLGSRVKVTGKATGGIGAYQYQILYKQTSQSSWKKAQDFNENPTVTFKPAKATTYDVCVKVKDESGWIDKKYFTVTVTA